MKKIIFLLIMSYAAFLGGVVLAADNIKKPNVAGAFYPNDPKELSSQIDSFLEKANPAAVDGQIACLISPHAGYEYSGCVAAYGYKAIKDKNYKTVFVIAFNHRYDFDGVSVWPSGAFSTPLGDIKVDSDAANKLIGFDNKIKFDPRAFSEEHSLEVQLPFLQKVLKDFAIVPVMIGNWDFKNCEILAGALKSAIAGRNDCLVIASTDMSHFYPYNSAVSIDSSTLKYLERMDVLSLYNDGVSRKIELCGLAPVVTTLLYAKSQNIINLKVLKYANSGDVTGDKTRVVGYTSCVLYKTPQKKEEGAVNMLNKDQKTKLLEIARKSLEDFVLTGKRTKFAESDPALTKEQGAFVTLTENGQLRGCIGRIVADSQLYLIIADMAIEAGTGDPRFYKVSPEELKNLHFEISVLTPLEKIDDVNKIQVGKHGLLIRKGFNSGLLLPQVATEYGWDRNTFLEQTCHKAGLSSSDWKSGAQIYIFSAQVFDEEPKKE